MMIASRVWTVVGCLVALQCAAAQDVVVKTMSFNVRTSYAGQDKAYRCGNWDGERKGNVVAQFQSVNADFVGTQETSDEQRGFLDGALKETYQSIGKSSGSLNGAAAEVNAIYYKVQDWKLLSDGMFWLGPNPDAPSAAWGMKYYRTCVWGRFQHIKSGKTVCVMNTHYETPGNDAAQIAGSEVILTRSGSVCQPTDKFMVILGDFNAPKSFPAMQKLLAANWLEPSDESTFCGDMLAPTCNQKFDYVLHQLRDGSCHLKTDVVRQEFAGCYPSDHAVVVGSFCIDGTCCGGPATTTAPSVNGTSLPASSAGSTASSTGGSAANEAEIVPGVVTPGQDEDDVSSPGVLTASDPTTSGPGASIAGGDSAQQISTQSEAGTNATGTVFAVVGVMGVAGVVCAFVLKKKRALEAQLDDQKSGLAPMSMSASFFSRAEEAALSPRASAQSAGRKYSSPVPTLEMNDEERKRSFSTTSSIACSQPTYGPMSERYSDSNRLSSPVMLDSDMRSSFDSERTDSRVYLSERISENSVARSTSNFAFL